MKQDKYDCSIIIGDVGIGFPFGDWNLPVLHPNHKFIRGNHDNPEVCREHTNYLGDFGYLKEQDIFFVSGGFSIDKQFRTENITWWPDEELSYKQGIDVLELYGEVKPRVVISHECPTAIKPYVLTNTYKFNIVSNTESLLQKMFSMHRPEYWIFGHHHKRLEMEIGTTKFIALKDIHPNNKIGPCVYEIPDIKF